MRLCLLGWATACVFSTGLLAQSDNYPYVLKQFAGNNNLGDGGPATAALLIRPLIAASDPNGNALIFDNGRFRQVNSTGVIHTVPIPLKSATDFKYTPDGTLYICTSEQVFKMSPSGQLTVIAGSLTGPFTSDDAPAITARLTDIFGVAVDSSGNVYFTENGSRVREVTTDGILHTFAGGSSGGFGGDGGPATAASLNFPLNLVFDSANNLYILDRSNLRIRRVTQQGIISTFAGNGNGGPPKNGPSTSSPLGIGTLFGGLAIDSKNNVYVGDSGNGVVDEIAPNGNLSTIAGYAQTRFGYYSDGPAGNVSFSDIQGVAIDPSGYPIVVDTSTGRIVEILPNGNVRTFAGKLHFSGDGGPATSAQLSIPMALAADGFGDVFISDGINLRIRKVTPDGKINTVAGSGLAATPSTTGNPLQSPLQNVGDLVTDAKGDLYFESDPGLPGPGQVFELSTADSMQLIAGQPGFGQEAGIGGPAVKATLQDIYGLTLDASNNLYLADFSNRVYEVSAASGVISAFAGTPQGGTLSGVGGPATSVPLTLRGSSNLANDSQGNIYIDDDGCECILSVSPGGIATLVAGNGMAGMIQDGQPATAPLAPMQAIAVDNAGNIYAVSDGIVLRISGGVVHIIAGQGTAPATDGAIASSVQFPFTSAGFEYLGGVGATEFTDLGITALAVDTNGDLYIGDKANSMVWKLVPDSPTGLTISGGNNQAGQTGWTLANPLQVVVNGRADVPVPGVTVNFAVTSGSAMVAASAVTDSTGTASVPLTLGANPGAVTVTATIAGFPAVEFNATVVGPPSGGGVTCTISGVPTVTSVNSATDFGGFSSFAPGSWLEVKGTNLAVDTRQWAGGDFQGANAPTGLDTSNVSIDGNAAFVSYISGGQINVQAPADSATGAVKLTVTTCAGTSAPFTVQEAAVVPGMLAPAAFNIGGKQYIVALFQDGVTFVGNSGLIPGVPFRPAAPGDSITAYGIGFGAVMPAIAPGTVVSQTNSIPNLTISFGQTPAVVTYGGLAPNAVGLYQFNITVPQVADGDYRINVSAGSVAVPETLYLTVKQ